MRLTNREKIMLGALILVGLIAVSYYLVIQPQLDKIAQYKLENEELKREVQTVKEELSTIMGLKAKIKILNQELQKKTERFYPAIYQDRFIVLFNSLITGVKCNSISFTEPILLQVPAQKAQPERQYPLEDLAESYKALNGIADENNNQNTESKAESKTANTQENLQEKNKKEAPLIPTSETMSVTLQINASYNNWIKFIKKIEALNRTVVVQNLVLADGEGSIAGSVLVNIYAIPKLQDGDQEYLEWPFEGEYGRTNPFVIPEDLPKAIAN